MRTKYKLLEIEIKERVISREQASTESNLVYFKGTLWLEGDTIAGQSNLKKKKQETLERGEKTQLVEIKMKKIKGKNPQTTFCSRLAFENLIWINSLIFIKKNR